MNVHINKMAVEDVSDVMLIGIENGLTEWGITGYLSEMGREDSLILVAKLQTGVIGFIALRLIISTDRKCNEAEIINFAVAIHFQKQGIGGKLLQQAIEGEKPQVIWLEVRKSNRPAVNFYLKNGFEFIGNRKNYYTSPVEDALLMKLKTAIKD
jgi:ribosomal-protein-alanine N-acetyltransferase